MSLKLGKYLKQFEIESLLGFADNHVIYSLSRGKENPPHSHTSPEDSRKLKLPGFKTTSM